MEKTTAMQRQMMDARGKRVKLILFAGFKPLIGWCSGYTQPPDNDPEVATIEIDCDNGGFYSIEEEEIESIEILAGSET